MKDEFWVVICDAEPSALGLVEKSRELAFSRNMLSCAVLINENESLADAIFAAGAERIYYINADASDVVLESDLRDCLTRLVESEKPEAVLFEYSAFTGAVAPAVAMKLNRGITADCTELKWDDSFGLLQIRPTFGGRKIAVNRSINKPYIATVRRGVFAYRKIWQSNETKEIIRVSLTRTEEKIKLLNIPECIKQGKSLTGAGIVLSGGLGLGSRENFDKLYLLAERLDAAVGASRAAVAEGFASYGHQVGQTGVSVRPDVYVAFGISGAVQHLSGIMGAGKIIAVNNDPKAPIHNYSDFSVIADCNAFIEEMLEKTQGGKFKG